MLSLPLDVGWYRAAVTNLRRLVGDVEHVAVLRTDLTGFDVMSHGAFATSIGAVGSLRLVEEQPLLFVPMSFSLGLRSPRDHAVCRPSVLSHQRRRTA